MGPEDDCDKEKRVARGHSRAGVLRLLPLRVRHPIRFWSSLGHDTQISVLSAGLYTRFSPSHRSRLISSGSIHSTSLKSDPSPVAPTTSHPKPMTYSHTSPPGRLTGSIQVDRRSDRGAWFFGAYSPQIDATATRDPMCSYPILHEDVYLHPKVARL